MAGSVVVDRDQAWRYCEEGGMKGPFGHDAWMVQITRHDLAGGSMAAAPGKIAKPAG